MQTEFEVKILDIDVDSILAKLHDLGAIKVAEKEQKRYIYNFNPKKENSFIRLRTDGAKTTLTIKEIENTKIDGTKELEIVVDDFEKTHLMLEKLEYVSIGYQENRRISYTLNNVEIEIDFWPLIPPYLEIEARSVGEVEEMMKQLGFELSRGTSERTSAVYKKYGLDIELIKELKFDTK